ncbi:MAG: hypothetical protein H7331_05370 [Bacteroidia bacterium]|nr:hypothetical protein [Bacteroidia bacterium]
MTMYYKKTYFKLLLIVLVLLTNKAIQAQSYIDYSLLNAQNYYNAEARLYDDTLQRNVITACKPFNLQNITNDALTKNKKYIRRKLFIQDFIVINDSNNAYLRINPILGVSISNDSAHSYQNTRGVYANGRLGKYLEFNTWFTENQALLPSYMQAYAKATEIIPGQGRYKQYKKTGVDYTNASGYISYTRKYVAVQVGSGKMSIGDGYRCLLMSANSLNYPFVRVSFNYRNFFYQTQYALLTHIDLNRYTTYVGSTEPYFDKSALTTHTLGASFFKHKLQLTLFDMRQTEASFNTSKGKFNGAMLNPFITLLPATTTNSGMCVKYRFVKKAYVYAQWLLNSFNMGKQLGIKSLDSFTLKGLTLQAEYTSNNALQSTVLHYNQPMAHPWNYNYNEIYATLNYVSNYGIGITASYNYLTPYNSLTTTIREGNISTINTNNSSGAHPSYFAEIQNQKITKLGLFYIPNNANYLMLTANYEQRSNTGTKIYNSNYLTVGVQCKLSNVFTDF